MGKMKINYNFVILFISFLFINVSRSADMLPDTEKSSIDQLISIYNLQYPTPIDDYCSLTNHFVCNSDFKNKTIKIYLDGLDLKPTFSGNIIKNFKYLEELNITNTILSDNFFTEIPSYYFKTFTLTSSDFTSFPTDIQSITRLYFNDVKFSGTIFTSTVSRVEYFDLMFSSQDRMGDYSFLDNLKALSQTRKNYSLTLNNFFNFSNFVNMGNLNLYLGSNFDMTSFQYLSTIYGSAITRVYPGFNTKPVYISSPLAIKVDLAFININFQVDTIIDFSQSIGSLGFDGCKGLKNSENDLNLILGPNLNIFTYINSDLTKFPTIVVGKLKFINISNNSITGNLPPLPIPTQKEDVLGYDMSNNNFDGVIPKNYCYHFIDLANNNLGGNLPDCYVCSLNFTLLRERIQGNNFLNYISGTTDYKQFPKCPGITMNPFQIALFGNSLITGENFGWYDTVLEGGNGYPAMSSTPSLSIGNEIPNLQLRTGSLSNSTYYKLLELGKFEILFIPQQITASATFTLAKPFVSYVRYRPYYRFGYYFFFVGSGLPFSKDNISSNGNITIDGSPCAIENPGGSTVGCVLPKPQLPEKEYQVVIYNSITKLYGTFTFKFERVAPWISAVHPPSPSGGLVTLFGSFTDGPYDSLSVEIGTKPCDLKNISEFIIVCNVGPGTGVQNITLTLNGTVFFGLNSFRYVDTSVPCNCGLYGECESVSGNCICDAGFGGATCEQIFIKDPVIVVNQTLVEIIKDGYSFGFSIKDIKEIDIESKVVRTYSLKVDDWRLVPSSNEQKWTYVHKINNTVISYTVEQIVGVQKTFEFAGQNITLQPGAIKLSASIQNWEYLGSLNTLKLQIESTAKTSLKSDCDGSSIGQNNDGSSINYLSIQKGEHVLYGRFIDKVMSDGRATFSSVSLEEQNDESITVSISMPYCKECLLDPDFSVLISNNNNCSVKKSAWIVPTAIVVSIVGFVVVMLGAYVLLKDKVYISLKKGNVGIFILNNSKSATSTTISMSSSD
ncbi:hypothetical protein DICPUDRAFT_75792 [Dictyostelium purpureum]|uniref:EGF-like domain-containing protein n=1 Tax=Dictyostelium purpureum TaxID=5786 RepID=F0ZBP1_DICPU|nr:uncharacterized protein DICPUDRAFT_75792 [Dictyostelium purpureum]EGC38630.1 hypothetical protein DICPUDRAFT_75792 [Dictyostelium purpureum]|eukprot:XP_003284823.1 hypothetical protein DICPUDRAFT_75792 [Dictyostelium purpureum]